MLITVIVFTALFLATMAFMNRMETSNSKLPEWMMIHQGNKI